MRSVKVIAASLLAVAATAGPVWGAPAVSAGPACPLPRFGPGADYHPHIVAAQFGPRIDNPWFPLTPGTTYVYAGEEDGHHTVDIVAPSRRTRVIDGVTTRAVHDRLLSHGYLSERTDDYYAQDRCGNVWYFGEDTAELDRNGHITSREGTWHAGVHGAEPGVFMQAHPQLHRRFRQEWQAGAAEDVFRAVSRHARVTVPYGDFRHALRTHESDALEPGVLDTKVYARGVGDVLERTLRGGNETLFLIDVLH